MRLIESNAASSPLPKLTFDSKIVLTPSILDRILSDIQAISDKITIEASKDKNTIFSGNSDNGDVKVAIDEKSNIENLQEISVTQPSKASFTLDFISKVVKAGGPLKLHLHFQMR